MDKQRLNLMCLNSQFGVDLITHTVKCVVEIATAINGTVSNEQTHSICCAYKYDDASGIYIIQHYAVHRCAGPHESVNSSI